MVESEDSNLIPQVPAPVMTVEDADAHLRQLKQGSRQELINSVNVRQDRKTGKYRWLWLEVPKEVVPLANYLGSMLPTVISGFVGEALYDNSSKIFSKINEKFKLGHSPSTAHKVGLYSAATFAATLIGAQPVFGIANAVRERSRERKEIRRILSSVIETNRAGYQNNEVIKTAMEKTHEHMVDGLKHVAADLPSMVTNGYFAFCDHQQLISKKNGKFNKEMASAANAAGGFDAQYNAFDEKVNAKRNEFENNGLTGEALDKKVANYARLLEDKWFDDHRDAEPEHQASKTTESGKLISVNAATAVGLLIKGVMKKDDRKNITAYQLIMELKEALDAGNFRNEDISKKIIEIFQQNEKDRGRSTFGPALMEKFQPLAERVGEVISGGELDALALVNLVGDGAVVNKRRFIKEEALEDLLDKQRKIFSLHEKTPLDEFLADFQNPAMIMKAVRENLQTLTGAEKAVFASLFSDDVLTHAGIKKTEILALRTQGHDTMYEFVKTSTLELAKQSHDDLKKAGLSEKQIESINGLNSLLLAGEEKEVKATIDRGEAVVGAVRNAKLHEQLSKPAGIKVWTQLVKKAPEIPKIIADAKPADTVVGRVEEQRNKAESGVSSAGIT